MSVNTVNAYGRITVTEEAIAEVAGSSALECYGVVGMAAPSLQDGIAKILPANRLRRGVIVTPREAGIHVDLYVVIEYGTNITVVSQNLIDNVTYVLNEFAQVPLDGIEVHVQGIKVRK